MYVTAPSSIQDLLAGTCWSARFATLSTFLREVDSNYDDKFAKEETGSTIVISYEL